MRHDITPGPHVVLRRSSRGADVLPIRAFAALSLLPTLKIVRGVVLSPVGHFVAYALSGERYGGLLGELFSRPVES